MRRVAALPLLACLMAGGAFAAPPEIGSEADIRKLEYYFAAHKKVMPFGEYREAIETLQRCEATGQAEGEACQSILQKVLIAVTQSVDQMLLADTQLFPDGGGFCPPSELSGDAKLHVRYNEGIALMRDTVGGATGAGPFGAVGWDKRDIRDLMFEAAKRKWRCPES